MPRYYPVYLDIEGRLCVVIGGGFVAERKVRGLLEGRARVRVVSPEATAVLLDFAGRGEIEYLRERYYPGCIEGAGLVFAATGDREVNAAVSAAARAQNVFVTVADMPDEGTFVVPSLVRRGDLCIAVSTGGNSPMLAAHIKAEMESRFGPEYEAFVELLGSVRDTVKEWTSDRSARRDAVGAILDHESELRALLADGRAEEARVAALSTARSAAGLPAEPN